MYDHYPLEKVSLQMFINGELQFPRHFPAEDELLVLWILIYPFIHILNFDINKSKMDRSCTEVGINFK